VEQLSVPSSYFLEVFQYPEIFVTLRQTLYLKTAQVISSQMRVTGLMFHSSNRFLDQKLLDRERCMSCSTVMVENPIAGPKFRPFSVYSFT
jgi:hypothetical protein